MKTLILLAILIISGCGEQADPQTTCDHPDHQDGNHSEHDHDHAGHEGHDH